MDTDQIETITIETIVEKHKVELKKWINEKSYRKIDLAQVMDDELKMKINSRNREDSMLTTPEIELTAEEAVKLMQKQENAKIEEFVVSIDGSQDNILERTLGFRRKDFKFVISQIDKLMQEDEDIKKKENQDIEEEFSQKK